ncbi:MAG: hypothetical protein A2163_11540 [Actinobacteria bacterium RBG_13_35_12]|nr:MAG: hypothetical protein A2163_11540 [Actinobacteria bacterium RBG_13_35_12]
MRKPKINYKYNILMLAILIFLVFFLITNIYTSINHLTVEKKIKRFGLENLYGFYYPEQENTIMYNWTRNEAVKILRKKGDVVCIPVGNSRPEIEENNVNLKITINDKIKCSYKMNSNDWKLVLINVKEIKDDYIKIKFDVDKTWRPIDLLEDSIDKRILGVKVGEIYWE